MSRATRAERIKKIIAELKDLADYQLHWIEELTSTLKDNHEFKLGDQTLFNQEWVEIFGDRLLIHHLFSSEPYTKDKFEHGFVNTSLATNSTASFAPRGNPGFDVSFNDKKISLKTQADRKIKPDELWISKYMELGKGEWSDVPEQLDGLRGRFLKHLDESDVILSLRCLQRSPEWYYELVEIPIDLLRQSQNGQLEMRTESRQMPKPGYCFVKDDLGEQLFQLYFDGGSERKLQIKSLLKSKCTVHAEWRFNDPGHTTNNSD